MEPEGSLPHSQVPAICPYHELCTRMREGEQGPLTETYQITYSKEQSPPWEANSSSHTPEIARKVHYRIHKTPPPVPILSQTKPVHVSSSHYLHIHFNIILPPTPACSKWCLSLGSPHQNPVRAPLVPPHVPHDQPISFFLIW